MKIDDLSSKDTYLSRLLLQLLFELLDGTASGHHITVNEQLNSVYLRLSKMLDKIAGLGFEKPFESLYAISEDIDIEWNEGKEKRNMLALLSQLDEMFANKGKQRFSLSENYDKETVALILNAYTLLKSYKRYKTAVEREIVEELRELGTINPKDHPENKYWFEGNAFYIRLAGNTIGSLVFETTRNKHKALETFKLILDYWNTNAENGKVVITRTCLINGLHKKGFYGENEDRVNDTISYLRKKIRARSLPSIVILGNHNKGTGYPFEIKQPS